MAENWDKGAGENENLSLHKLYDHIKLNHVVNTKTKDGQEFDQSMRIEK